jgi:hypothetical protein
MQFLLTWGAIAAYGSMNHEDGSLTHTVFMGDVERPTRLIKWEKNW